MLYIYQFNGPAVFHSLFSSQGMPDGLGIAAIVNLKLLLGETPAGNIVMTSSSRDFTADHPKGLRMILLGWDLTPMGDPLISLRANLDLPVDIHRKDTARSRLWRIMPKATLRLCLKNPRVLWCIGRLLQADTRSTGRRGRLISCPTMILW